MSQRLRFRFAKLGKVRFTSHRDLARMWERAFRRVELPLAYSEGFSPRPKLAFGLALPTGAESLAEYLDVDLVASAVVDVAALPETLSAALPLGVDVTAAGVLADGTASLQQEVTSCEWELTVPGVTAPELAARVAHALAASSLVVTSERKGHVVEDDLRPAIVSLAALPPVVDGAFRLHAELASAAGNQARDAEAAGQSRRTVRPSELAEAVCPGLEVRRVRRIAQWIERDGTRREPLSLPMAATSAPHAQVRAS